MPVKHAFKIKACVGHWIVAPSYLSSCTQYLTIYADIDNKNLKIKPFRMLFFLLIIERVYIHRSQFSGFQVYSKTYRF